MKRMTRWKIQRYLLFLFVYFCCFLLTNFPRFYQDVSPVTVAEILVSPVTVTYEKKIDDKEEDGKIDWCEHHKTYWLVILKTKRCYDFAGHLSSIIAWDEDIMPKMRKIHEGLGKSGISQYLHWITELSRKVLLYNYKFSPNVNSFLKMKDQVIFRVFICLSKIIITPLTLIITR